MTENIQELTNTPRRDVRIDREGGVLFDVKIIGCSSRNGREYPNDTLRDAIPLYENSKVNLDHPEGNPRKPRSYQDRFGVIRNVRLKENDGLFGDFRFNTKHAVAEQLLWDAEYAPENVGFSHNVEAIVRRDDDKVIVEKIVSVRSVDLVADPATTSGLFESVQTESVETIAEQSEKPNGLALLCESLLKYFRDAIPGMDRIVNEKFLGLLESVSDPDLQRQMVEDRIRLIEQIQRRPVEESKPVCREQVVSDSACDSKAFVRMIKKS